MTETAAEAQPYRVRLTRRVRLQGHVFGTGEVVVVAGADALRRAAGLVATRQARPGDARAETDVGLFLALRSATS